MTQVQPNQQENKVVKRNITQFLNTSKVSSFLEDQLKSKKAEFVSNLIALTNTSAALQQCDPDKLMRCAMNATALNLPLNSNLGYAYVIPYKNREGEQIPQFQVSYKGLIQLAIRSGMYKTIHAVDVRDGEIEWNKFTGEFKLIGEKPDNRIIGYLAFLELTSGFSASVYMTEEEIEKHAMQFSKTYQADKKYKKRASTWSDPAIRPKMAIKTVLKKLLSTYGVLSVEMQNALVNDTEPEAETLDINSEDVTSNHHGNITINESGNANEPTKININDI